MLNLKVHANISKIIIQSTIKFHKTDKIAYICSYPNKIDRYFILYEYELLKTDNTGQIIFQKNPALLTTNRDIFLL